MRFRELPAAEIQEFFPKRSRFCFAPIVYNEGERFKRQLADMEPRRDLADIVVVERRGTDGSTEPAHLRARGVRALVTTDAPGGASAVRLAVAYALDQGYDGLILVDGHGKDGVAALPEYLKRLDEGYDFVQGSRFMAGGRHENTPLLRRLGIRFIAAPLFYLSGGILYTDPTNGFRGYSRHYLSHPKVEPLRACFVNFNLQLYLSYMAGKGKFRVIEIPVSRIYPKGEVPTKVTGFYRNFLVFWETLMTSLGRYDPPPGRG
jgi:hypothetical protein